jgi:hypothetical protein
MNSATDTTSVTVTSSKKTSIRHETPASTKVKSHGRSHSKDAKRPSEEKQNVIHKQLEISGTDLSSPRKEKKEATIQRLNEEIANLKKLAEKAKISSDDTQVFAKPSSDNIPFVSNPNWKEIKDLQPFIIRSEKNHQKSKELSGQVATLKDEIFTTSQTLHTYKTDDLDETTRKNDTENLKAKFEKHKEKYLNLSDKIKDLDIVNSINELDKIIVALNKSKSTFKLIHEIVEEENKKKDSVEDEFTNKTPRGSTTEVMTEKPKLSSANLKQLENEISKCNQMLSYKTTYKKNIEDYCKEIIGHLEAIQSKVYPKPTGISTYLWTAEDPYKDNRIDFKTPFAK